MPTYQSSTEDSRGRLLRLFADQPRRAHHCRSHSSKLIVISSKSKVYRQRGSFRSDEIGGRLRLSFVELRIRRVHRRCFRHRSFVRVAIGRRIPLEFARPQRAVLDHRHIGFTSQFVLVEVARVALLIDEEEDDHEDEDENKE